MAPSFSFILLAALVALTPSLHVAPQAAATSIPGLQALKDDIVPLSPEEVSAFKPYTWYAAAAACNVSDILEWDCGTNCEANPTFKPVATGGDGYTTPFWYVGYDPLLDTTIVAHQGGSDGELWSLLSTYSTTKARLDPNLFPGVDPSVEVHEGFAAFQRSSAPAILAAVEKTLSTYPTKHITAVGYSLGAAIALIDTVYLPLHLPSNVTINYRGYSSPRVGNQAFADYFDSLEIPAVRLNNKEDPIPILPPITFFGYHHVSGEVHIKDNNEWVWCPGQDNPSDQCSTGDVGYYKHNFNDHPGPFDGVILGTCGLLEV